MPHDQLIETRSFADQLLHPITLEEFRRRWFDQRSLHVRSADPRRFATWFGYESLDRAAWGSLDPGAPAQALPVFAVNGASQVPIDARLARDFFALGSTIAVNAVDGNDPRLRAVAEDLATRLDFRGQTIVNAYLSPEGKGAFGQHFDDQHVVILQIEGHKRWRYGRSASAPNPRFAATRDVFEESELGSLSTSLFGTGVALPPLEDLEDVTLGPGDVLYLPPGTWHATAAVDGPSLALTVTLVPFRACDAILAFVTSKALAHDAWFADLARGAAVRASLQEGLARLRAILESADADDVLRAIERLEGLPPPLLQELLATTQWRMPASR